MVRDAVTQLDPDNFGFDVVEVAPQYDVSDTNSYNGGITSGFANRLIIEVLGSMALADRDPSEGSPIKPKEPLGPQPDLEASADD
ncbi:hypothetical protein [Halalkalicoccus subterraneus]|uniref:hypothetical protein n=1 Tax=Halalkalicoccus subterraneus TaxID=2675002 RepID=UPI001FE35518|nr:hypothetical protein [Halalkalicoccus subterraneus]